MPSMGTLAVPKKPDPKGRVELRAPQSFIDEATRVAETLGLSLSAYIRLLLSEDIARRKREEMGTDRQRM